MNTAVIIDTQVRKTQRENKNLSRALVSNLPDYNGIKWPVNTRTKNNEINLIVRRQKQSEHLKIIWNTDAAIIKKYGKSHSATNQSYSCCLKMTLQKVHYFHHLALQNRRTSVNLLRSSMLGVNLTRRHHSECIVLVWCNGSPSMVAERPVNIPAYWLTRWLLVYRGLAGEEYFSMISI